MTDRQRLIRNSFGKLAWTKICFERNLATMSFADINDVKSDELMTWEFCSCFDQEHESIRRMMVFRRLTGRFDR
jgi:hypothetical protein